jgi:hypothetical protein
MNIHCLRLLENHPRERETEVAVTETPVRKEHGRTQENLRKERKT